MEQATELKLPEHFSVSQADKYNKCGLAYKYAYFDKLTPKFSEKMWFGGVMHSAIASWLQLWKETGGKVKQSASEIYGCCYDAKAIGENLWQHLQKPEEYAEKKAEGLELFLKFREFFREVLQIEKLLYIEENMTLCQLHDKDVIGILDCATEEGTIYDWKTGGRTKQIDLTKDLQMQMYALGFFNATGHHAKRLVQVQLVRSTRKIVVLEVPVMEKHIREAVQDIEDILILVEAGLYKRNRSSWYCSPQYCDFYNICYPPF